MFAQGIGTVDVEALIDGECFEVALKNVEYVPRGANLFSENIAIRSGLTVKKNDRSVKYFRAGHRDLEAVFDVECRV